MTVAAVDGAEFVLVALVVLAVIGWLIVRVLGR